MEKRIKIVWVLSLVSALVLIAVQCYWLYTQYRYEINSYTEQIALEILAAGDKEYAIRKDEKGGSFSYKIQRDMEFSNTQEGIKRNTMMAFSTGISDDDRREMTEAETNHMIDSIMQDLKGKKTVEELTQKAGEADLEEIENLSDKELKEIYIADLLNNPKINLDPDRKIPDTSAIIVRNKADIKRIDKEKISELSIAFNPNMPEEAIVDGMNRAFVNKEIPFRLNMLDSILQEQVPEASFTFIPFELKDSITLKSSWEKSGTLFSPKIKVTYAYSPFERMGVSIETMIPPQPLFRQMATQLLLALSLILLLIGCLIFQIKTIMKQRKVGEMRQHFVNTMIHELKRPVQTLKTFVSFLGDKEMRTDEQMTGQIVQDSMFELDNLSAYLNKLKDMVRADDESTPLHISRFNLHELADKVIRLTHIPTGKQATFTTQFEMESPFIEADPIHVANVLSNLIENAIKYSGEKVEITINARRKANDLWLTVSDNGIGIPLVEQDKVFAKFYRGSNMPDLTIPGLGLGLSYVKLISEAHHGSVSLSSNLGQGTSVTLYLPQ